jgi:predicted metalloendopeptidase
MAGIRAKYLQHLTNMLTLAGEANAAARAKAILDFETRSRGSTGRRSKAATRPRPTTR